MNTFTKRLRDLALAAALTIPVTAVTDPLDQWMAAFWEGPQAARVSDHETTCLARVIYHEARGEKLAGKLAVAQVAVRRTEHEEFPDTICGVIKAKNAFPWAAAGRHTPMHTPAFKEAKRLAQEVLLLHVNGIEWGPAKTKDSLFFNTVPFPYKRLKYDGKIGAHLFYSLKD